jgi:TPR repeat protein
MSLCLRLPAVIAVLIVTWPFAAAADPIAEARRAADAAQYRRAIELVRPLAEKGDPQAQHLLGNFYWDAHTQSGLSDEEEKKHAFVWLEKSAAQNYRPAIRDLGYLLLETDEKSARRGYGMLLKLAREGDLSTQALLGQYIASRAGQVTSGGFRVPGTAADGLKWLERAADKKHLPAVIYLGWWHIRNGKATDAYFWQIIDAVMGGHNRMMVWPDTRKKLTKEQIAAVERHAAAWLKARGYAFRRPDPARR